MREGTDGMEKGKRNREEANSAKGKGQASGELDPKISPTQGGAVRRIWAKGGREERGHISPLSLPHMVRGQGSLGLLHTIKISVSAPLNRSVASSSPLHMSTGT